MPHLLSREAQSAVSSLSNARIFFGHQSVGENIIDGLRTLEESTVRRLRVVDGLPDQSAGAFFAHTRLGKNGDPLTKTAAFSSALRAGLGARLDIALHKYCYVDIHGATDVAALFDSYRTTLGELAAEFPRMILVHVTVPLTCVQGGARAVIKKWIGRVPDYYEENIARHHFNELMRNEYAGRAPVFDLEALESTRPGSTPEAVSSFRGQKVYALRPEYTSDGGHLNAAARARIAAELVLFLSRTLERQLVASP